MFSKFQGRCPVFTKRPNLHVVSGFETGNFLMGGWLVGNDMNPKNNNNFASQKKNELSFLHYIRSLHSLNKTTRNKHVQFFWPGPWGRKWRHQVPLQDFNFLNRTGSCKCLLHHCYHLNWRLWRVRKRWRFHHFNPEKSNCNTWLCWIILWLGFLEMFCFQFFVGGCGEVG